ncbi:MAG: diaminopimelate epimerase [Candidatus Caldatribacterium sp.]|nr:diaminopimelate epimerase [Candidatus Caldatribacterium sp.]
MRFVKMHGLGNDFLLCTPEMLDSLVLSPPLVQKLCDRHFGIGADGVIEVLPSEVADVKMRIWNADGSEAEMCGNGIRCLAKFAFERGMVAKETFRVETKAGIIVPMLLLDRGRVTRVVVDMGEPSFLPSAIPMNLEGEAALSVPLEVEDRKFTVTGVSMGNPHAVIFELPEDWKHYGPLIEHHPLFPRRTNVEFVRVVDPENIVVAVWERGAGATLACGTGACAAVAAGVAQGILRREVRVQLPGGELRVVWKESDNHMYLEGPAEEVCTCVLSEEVVKAWMSPRG